MEVAEYIKKWLDDDLTKEELEVFQKTKDFQSLIRLDNALNAFKAPAYHVEEELIKVNQQKPGQLRGSWVRPWMKVAAAVVLLISTFYVFTPKSGDETTRIVSQSNESFYLPDSSKVILNKGSVLTYDHDLWGKERKVNLRGEGYFEVKRGSSFEVKTDQGNVRVLGTAFNVISRLNYFAVDCYYGKVEVTAYQKEAVLTADERIRIINSSVGSVERITTGGPAWIVGESSFESVPLTIVLAEFERQYDVKVEANEINVNKSFTGSFTHTDIHLAIRSISVPLDLKYKINNSVVTLLSESPD